MNEMQETSLAAWRQATPRRRDRVLALLRSNPTGLTIDQLAVLEHVTPNMISPATNWLLKRGFIFDSDERRKTRWHRDAIVWRLTLASPPQA